MSLSSPDANGGNRVERVGVRPYARLLTMLGEQLIKNDRIALVELIKNSYDADARTVRVDLLAFASDLRSKPGARIVLVDDGLGMPERTIRDHWLNPATPSKQDLKKSSRKSPGGRVIQGEKGIGRFAMFKLGNRVNIVTRAIESDLEFVIDFDLSFLDVADGLEDDQPVPHIFIDEIEVQLGSRQPSVFDGSNQDGLKSTHGTRLEIHGLRSSWTEASVRAAYSDVSRLQPLVPQAIHDAMSPEAEVPDSLLDFSVEFYRDGKDLELRETEEEELRRLFEERAVLGVTGHFSDGDKAFLLNVNGHTSFVRITDPEIAGLRIFRNYFLDPKNPRNPNELQCGSFDFSFYVFDLTPKAPVEYRLDNDERRRVKDHRIYLYRDGVRVLPYGDVDDDWLQLDVIRGTQGADRVLSNDQTVGFVYISQGGNPHLRDKTNREGLLESGRALGDFVTLLQLVISHVRRSDFARYLAEQERKRETRARRSQKLESDLGELAADARLPAELSTQVRDLERKYLEEKQYMNMRLERTEDLAGVGLSVESASHDIISTANQALRLSRSVARYVKGHLPDHEVLLKESRNAVEALSFVTSRLEDVQGLFVSTRKGKRQLEPAEFVTKVYRMYSSVMDEHGVRLDLDRGSSPLRVKSTDAALLQVLVNLFDNAIYWLDVANTLDPRIVVSIRSDLMQLVFADNGPGVRPEDSEFIFEPFYSGKGESGKGLGLYIARQVSARNGFSIDLVTDESQKIESGANFVLSFGRDGVRHE